MAKADDTLRKNFVELFPELEAFCSKRIAAPEILMMYTFNFPHSQISKTCSVSERLSRLIVQEASSIVRGRAGREFKAVLLLRILGSAILGSAFIGAEWWRLNCLEKEACDE